VCPAIFSIIESSYNVHKADITVIAMIAPWGACAPFVIARIREFDLDQIQGCHTRTTLNSGVDDVLDNWQIADRTREPKIKTDGAVRRDGRSFVPLF
jgi:hypothetical protein